MSERIVVHNRKQNALAVSEFVGSADGPYVTIAASNSRQWFKDRAYAVCTGVDDHLTINQAVSEAQGNNHHFGIVALLYPGRFKVASNGIAVQGFAVHYKGMGPYLTEIVLQNNDNGTGWMVPLRGRESVSNLSLDGNRDEQTGGLVDGILGISGGSSEARVDTVRITNCSGAALHLNNGRTLARAFRVRDCGQGVNLHVEDFSEPGADLSHFEIESTDGEAIFADSTYDLVISNGTMMDPGTSLVTLQNCFGVRISGCKFAYASVGITIDAATVDSRIGPNYYESVATNIVNNGGATNQEVVMAAIP